MVQRQRAGYRGHPPQPVHPPQLLGLHQLLDRDLFDAGGADGLAVQQVVVDRDPGGALAANPLELLQLRPQGGQHPDPGDDDAPV